MFPLARSIPRLVVIVLLAASLALTRHTANAIVRADGRAIGGTGGAEEAPPRKIVHIEKSGPGLGPNPSPGIGGGAHFGERRWLKRYLRTSRRSRMAKTPAEAKSNRVGEGYGFPQVFSAIVSTRPPVMNNGTSSGDGVEFSHDDKDGEEAPPGMVVNFLSEVDLMHVKEREDEDGGNGSAKIFFVVHSRSELDYLMSIANAATAGAPGSGSSTQPGVVVDASSFRLDARRTEELHAAVDNVRQGGRGNAGARMIEEEDSGTAGNGDLPRYSTIPGHPCFRDLAGTYAFLRHLNSTGDQDKPGPIVTVRDIGDSYLKTQDARSGYDILAINITGNGVIAADHGGATTNANNTKATFLALFGVHAREYSPPELGARFAEMLIKGYGTDADITSILDHTEIHLILHVNPDGREVAERGILQRKNMHDYSVIKECDTEDVGVDLNRNFPFKWGLDSGSSENPCSHGYRGPHAASEPETRAVMDYAMSIFPEGQRMDGNDTALSEAYDERSTSGVFFDVHASGGLNLYPFSFEERTFPDVDVLRTIATRLRRYNDHRIKDFWYEASGTSGDWSYATLGAATQIFEIGDDEFQDCEVFEHDVASGNLEALLYATRLARAPYGMARGPDVIDVALSSTSVDIGQDDVGGSSLLTVSVDVEGSSPSSEKAGMSTIVVMLFVDIHPYDRPVVSGSLSPEGTANNATTFYSSWERQAAVETKVTTSDAGNTQTVNFSLSNAQLLPLLRGPTVTGRHVLHVLGMDHETGHAGPVKSVYFDVYNSTSEGGPREWTVLTSDQFEFGWGNWSYGGKHARRYVGADYRNGGYAPSGTAAIELRGGFGTDSTIAHRHSLDVSDFTQLRMTFSFYVRRFNNRDEFLLELSHNGGESWETVKSWMHGDDIESDHVYEDEVVLMNSTVYDFADTMRLRFRSGANRKKESVYFDDVELAGRR